LIGECFKQIKTQPTTEAGLVKSVSGQQVIIIGVFYDIKKKANLQCILQTMIYNIQTAQVAQHSIVMPARHNILFFIDNNYQLASKGTIHFHSAQQS
jgi:type II secretory pathway predicted ATPase ExeA